METVESSGYQTDSILSIEYKGSGVSLAAIVAIFGRHINRLWERA